MEAALLAAIEVNPDDESPRLIYSDWLDEQGRTDEAELIRIQCQLAKYQTAHLKQLVLFQQTLDQSTLHDASAFQQIQELKDGFNAFMNDLRGRESELLEIIAQKPPVQVGENSWKVGSLIVTQKRSF